MIMIIMIITITITDVVTMTMTMTIIVIITIAITITAVVTSVIISQALASPEHHTPPEGKQLMPPENHLRFLSACVMTFPANPCGTDSFSPCATAFSTVATCSSVGDGTRMQMHLLRTGSSTLLIGERGGGGEGGHQGDIVTLETGA